jgi:hypothetical protein
MLSFRPSSRADVSLVREAWRPGILVPALASHSDRVNTGGDNLHRTPTREGNVGATDVQDQGRNWKVVDTTVLIPGIFLKLDLAIVLISLM